jgi:transketolase
MEQLKNHHGDNSLLVLRPADVHETTYAWKLAMDTWTLSFTAPTAHCIAVNPSKRTNVTAFARIHTHK